VRHALTLHRPLSVHRWGGPAPLRERHALGLRQHSACSCSARAPGAGRLRRQSRLQPRRRRDVLRAPCRRRWRARCFGVPSIAVSLVEGDEFADAARVARQVAVRVLVSGLPPMTLLNVNVPAGVPKGVRLTRLGHRVYFGQDRRAGRPARGRAHYWIGAGPPEWEALDRAPTCGAVHEGYASVTTLQPRSHGPPRSLAQMTDWEPALKRHAAGAPRAQPATVPPPRSPAASKTAGKRRRRSV